MIKADEFSICDYLNESFSCNCGKNHRTQIKAIEICQGAIQELPKHIGKLAYKKVFLVSDENTHKVAGNQINNLLKEKHIQVVDFVFEDPLVVPDEKTMGELMTAIDDDCDLIIAVGAGTINDICKYMSYKLNLPYFIVATAPSMDGFASTGAALIINNVKTTYTTHSPEVIIADIDVLKEAPIDMITAGVGDILGKYTCLCDWKLAHLINDEYYCETVVEMVNLSIKKVADHIDQVRTRDPKAIYHITEALMLAGIAMSFVGNSRPASGSEHHISHYWEMKFLMEGKQAILHGTKVGIGSVAILKLYEYLQKQDIDFKQARESAKAFNMSKWEENIKKTFGKAAPGVIELEKETGKNNPKGQLKRIDILESKWSEITKAMSDLLPQAQMVEHMLAKIGAPINPGQIGIDDQTMIDSIIVAKEVRDRYTLLQIMWDLGISKEMATKISLYFKQEQETYKDMVEKKQRTLLEKVKCFVLDMDGTIYLGYDLFPFTYGFLNKLKEVAKDHYFFTNNSSKNADYYVNKLKGMNIPIEPEKMLISNGVIISYLKENYPGKSVYIVGTQYLEDDFTKAGILIDPENPDLVILGFDLSLTYDKLERACNLVRAGVPILGVNPDLNCPVEGGGFIPDCGAMAALVEASTGVMPEFFGKPSKHTLDYIIKTTGYKQEEIAIIGDRLYTDIALVEGTKAVSILVLTGETKQEDIGKSLIKPDLTFESLEELTNLLTKIYN